MDARRPASGYASGRSRTPFTTLNTAALPPIPNASVNTAAAVKPGVLRSWRTANRRSYTSRSTPRAPRPSRMASLWSSSPPKARAARRRASTAECPARACFAASISMWKRISSSSSRSTDRFARRLRSHIRTRFVPRMSCLEFRESSGAEELLHCQHEPAPTFGLSTKSSATERGEAVILRATVVVRDLPVAVDPLLLLEALECRVERALIDFKHAVAQLLNALSDPPSMHRCEGKGAEDEQIDGAPEGLGRRFAHGSG